MSEESRTTYPYPERQTLFLDRSGESLLRDIEPLSLSRDERETLRNFDEELYNRIKEARGKTSKRALFVDYLTTQEGWQELCNLVPSRNAEPRDTQEAVSVFLQADLEDVSFSKWRKLEANSENWARDVFLEQVFDSRGDLENIKNPSRNIRVLNPDEVVGSVGRLRGLKQELKERERREERSEEGTLSEAKRIVLRLYREKVNTLLAQNLADVVAIASGQLERAGEPEEPRRDRSRTLARLDHFIQGVGLRINKQGLFETVPEEFAQFLEQKVRSANTGKSETYERYAKHRVNFDQAKRVARTLFRYYGQEDGDLWEIRSWPKGYFNTPVGDGKYYLDIPEGLDRPLPDFLSVLAHEKVHLFRYFNKKAVDLALIQRSSTARQEGLFESATMYVEEVTAREAFDTEDRNVRAYYWIIKEKEEGGSFKECFMAALQARVGGEQGLQQLFGDKQEFMKEGKEAYRQTLRIFRAGGMSLNDRSGYAANSEEMAYQEYGLVWEKMEKLGMTKALCISGVDVYSLSDLLRLGVLDLDKIVEPQWIVLNKIWPTMKRELDDGKSLDEAIDVVEEESKEFFRKNHPQK